MLTFAFVALSFILFAAGGFFAYRYARQELKTALKSHIRRGVQKDRSRANRIIELQNELVQVNATMRQILALPANKNVVPIQTYNVKENMEARAIRENPQVVAVDGVQKVING